MTIKANSCRGGCDLSNCAGIVRRAQTEIDRLRGLVKQTEDLIDGCPWCHQPISHDEQMGHAEDCPAFTPDGVVR